MFAYASRVAIFLHDATTLAVVKCSYNGAFPSAIPICALPEEVQVPTQLRQKKKNVFLKHDWLKGTHNLNFLFFLMCTGEGQALFFVF